MTGPRENRTHLIFCVQDRRPRHAVPKPKYATYLCIDGVANHLRSKFASLQRIPREGWCRIRDSNSYTFKAAESNSAMSTIPPIRQIKSFITHIAKIRTSSVVGLEPTFTLLDPQNPILGCLCLSLFLIGLLPQG